MGIFLGPLVALIFFVVLTSVTFVAAVRFGRGVSQMSFARRTAHAVVILFAIAVCIYQANELYTYWINGGRF